MFAFVNVHLRAYSCIYCVHQFNTLGGVATLVCQSKHRDVPCTYVMIPNTLV